MPTDKIDLFIKAELPRNNTLLRQKIAKVMTHSKDHLTRENSRCRTASGNCQYHFPETITPRTWVDDDGRVHYRRRHEEDLWIAPHVPEWIDELQCHIHTDIVFTSAVFPYLYKYLFKGPDHALFHIHTTTPDIREPINEPKDYINGRYLSSPEGAWRILGFKTTSKEPSVNCLPIHLPGENIPQFNHTASGGSASLLIRYFHRPNLPQFDRLLYTDYFENYILYPWKPHDKIADDEYLEVPITGSVLKKVCPRRQGHTVTRIQIISPTLGELFYLRCLLQHRPARSFTETRTINSVTYETYHEAAVQLGLFDNVNEGYYALQEAIASYQTPHQLRFLFARIVLEGYPARPLWDHFRNSLTIDLITSTHSEERGTDRALYIISQYLQDGGQSLQKYGLPEPIERSGEILLELEAFRGREQQLRLDSDISVQQMNTEQLTVFNMIWNTIITGTTDTDSHDTRNIQPVFLEGKPGRGKTFIVDAICSRLQSEGKIVLIVGTSALAAALYEHG